VLSGSLVVTAGQRPARTQIRAANCQPIEEDAMHPLFAELFMKPDELLEDRAGERRRARWSRQRKTVTAARGKPGAPRAALAGPRTS
jgi:hypothetical protein